MSRKPRILIIDDAPQIRDLFQIALSGAYDLDAVASPAQAMAEFRHDLHKAFFVDVSLSYNATEGLDLIRTLRAEGDPRVCIAMSGLQDRLLPSKCYDAGADGFLRKPFPIAEARSLLARLLTRATPHRNGTARLDGVSLPTVSFPFAGATIHPDLTITFPNGVSLRLRPKAVGILHHFSRHAGGLVKRSELLAEVWGPTANPASNTADAHLSALRRQYRENGLDFATAVHPIPNVGWSLSPDAATMPTSGS